MNRLHVHIRVNDLDRSRAFYAALFGAEPTKVKPDYVQWRLDDPRVNFAISPAGAGAATGVDHLGVQSDDEAGLEALNARLLAAGEATAPEKDTTCCYAHSNKHWTADPDGVVWEAFHTMADAAVFGTGAKPDLAPATAPTTAEDGGACCP